MLEGRLLHRLGRRAEALVALRGALDLDEAGDVTLALRDLLRESEAGAPDAGPDDLAARHDLVVTALRRRARAVACVRCGAEASARLWRCRSCGTFDAFP
jgi:lipopolysaccharide biosynthesis regulator YciM